MGKFYVTCSHAVTNDLKSSHVIILLQAATILGATLKLPQVIHYYLQPED